jgi:GNAT superfamily N-acetyltransferase
MEVCRVELAVTPEAIAEKEYWIAGSDPLLGCVCLSSLAPGIGEVNAYFVAPEAQRQGIGRLLWAKLLERAKAKGMHALRLDSDPFAVPFYEGLGFNTIGQSPSGSIPGRVLPRMEYRLPRKPDQP